MILKRCSRGCEPQSEPLTWTVSAWVRADGTRVAYKQKLCLTCVSGTLAPMHVACERPEMTCPGCGLSTEADMDPVWITWIPKGVGTLHTDAPFCGACAARYRIWAQEGAQKLERDDEGLRGRDNAPQHSLAGALQALGVTLPEGL